MKNIYLATYYLLYPIVMLLWPYTFTGRTKIPDGAAIVCANHSNFIDPILVAYAFGKKYFLHFMAKIELFKKPVLGGFMRINGAFGIDRSGKDIGGIRTAMKYLRSGEKVMMFPEGTRVNADDAVEARTGAVRLAAKLQVPIVPVYVPRRKKIFGRIRIHIGEPYYIDRADHANYGELSSQLMEKISGLRAERS